MNTLITFIRNLKIQQKLAASFSLILLTFLAHSIYGWIEGVSLINAARDLQEKDYLTSRDGLILEEKFTNLGKIYVDAISFSDDRKLAKTQEIETDFTATINDLKKYEVKDIHSVEEMETAFAAYTVMGKNLVSSIIAKKESSEIEKGMNEFSTLHRTLKDKIKNYTSAKDTVFRNDIANMKQRIKTFNQITIAITIVILIGGMILSVLVARNISTRLTSMITLATKISEGDFTQRFTVNSQDEIGILSGAFIRMSDRLSAMIKNIREVTHHVASATEQMGKNTKTVMEGARNQASCAETGSSSIIEMNSAIMEISSNVESLSSSSEITSSSILEISASFNEVTNATVGMVGQVNDTSASIVE
ncbi:MAG: methyl-accepting chemotaxis protein, partial [Nitrospirae bacterium]|nr:methyl-accepting chemotaxis protein [Nitrospirota bacterium]